MSHYIDTPARLPPSKKLFDTSDPTVDRLKQIKLDREQAAQDDRKGRLANDELKYTGAPKITSDILVASCLTNGGYEAPALNDKL